MSPVDRYVFRHYSNEWGTTLTRTPALLTLVLLTSCTTFVTVRPARVHPGTSFHAQATMAAPPGELPGWIWSFDCTEGCNHAMPGGEIGLSHGVSDSARAYYGGAGLMAPLTPYVEAYRQLTAEPHAQGIGFRAGLPVTGWGEYRLFYRRDIGTRVTANTHFVVATGSSPNGENKATFIALVQSVGMVDQGAHATGVPAISLGVTRTTRDRYGDRDSAYGLLAHVSVGVAFHRKRRQ